MLCMFVCTSPSYKLLDETITYTDSVTVMWLKLYLKAVLTLRLNQISCKNFIFNTVPRIQVLFICQRMIYIFMYIFLFAVLLIFC